MSPSLPPALLAIRSAPTTTTTPTQTTQTTPIVPATTCDHRGMYTLPQILGDDNKSLLRDASIFAVPNWNESLAGMTACCRSNTETTSNSNSNSNNSNNSNENENKVHVGGPEHCELWCLIPDEFLYGNNRTRTDDKTTEGNDAPKKRRNPGSTAASLMKSCVKREGNITEEEDFITMWQVKDDAEGSAAAAGGRRKMMSMKMVVAGVVGWGVVFGGLLA